MQITLLGDNISVQQLEDAVRRKEKELQRIAGKNITIRIRATSGRIGSSFLKNILIILDSCIMRITGKESPLRNAKSVRVTVAEKLSNYKEKIEINIGVIK